MKILAIESSADESGVALIEADGDFGAGFKYTVLGNALASQTATHTKYGGIYPNMAVREHQQNFVPLLASVLEQAGMRGGVTEADVSGILARETELRGLLEAFFTTQGKPAIDAIAVTHGPGLEPTLWVGVNFAKALSAAWNVPIVPVNHMEGHVIIAMITSEQFTVDSEQKIENASPVTCKLSPVNFPLLSLLISGGHTELVLSREWMQYELVGQTRDDAVGEAFDKVARLMGLPYPGGPEISKLAAEARSLSTRSDLVVNGVMLPRPMMDSGDFDFSFAGLKTAVRKVVEAEELTDERRKMIALEFEEASADVLIAKTMRAIEEYGAQTVLVGGGVSANTHIRTTLAQAIKDYGLGTKLLVPPPAFATDNALMIALAGYFRAARGEFAEPDSIRAQGNLKLA